MAMTQVGQLAEPTATLPPGATSDARSCLEALREVERAVKRGGHASAAQVDAAERVLERAHVARLSKTEIEILACRVGRIKTKVGGNSVQRRPQVSWHPGGASVAPDVGVIDGTDFVVSFKTTPGPSREVLIREGDYGDHSQPGDPVEDRDRYTARSAEFNRRGRHDHYGFDRVTGERFEEVRGFLREIDDASNCDAGDS